MVIHVNIVDKRAAVTGAPVIVCGNSGYTVEFTFDADWDGLDAKTARFVYVQAGAVKYQDVVFSGNTAAVPVLANTKEVRIGVFAGDLQTTTPAVIPCELSIRCGTGAPADPTPSQYDQIMKLLAAGGGGGSAEVTAESIVEALGFLPADAVAIGDLHERVSDVAMQIDTKQPYGDYALKSDVSTHNTSNASHNDIRLLISGLTSRLDALANSDDTTLDQLSEIVAYIKANKSLIDSITTRKVNVSDIVNNLTSNVTNKPLSAAQGVALKALIDAIKIPDVPVQSVNGKTGAVKLTASDVGAADADLVSKISVFVTPQMYGAKADGTTDDTAAIQAALDASSYVYIPDGTYMINAVKSSGGILYPRDNQTIVLSDKAVLKAFTTSSSAHIIFLLENVENVHIRGGKVQGERSAYDTPTGEQGYGIYLSGSRKVTVEQMEIFDFRGDGIMVRYYGGNSENSKDVTISNCVIHDCNRQGISISGAVDMIVKDCEIYNIDGAMPMSGIDIEPEGGVGVCKNISIENCHIHDTTQASIILAGVDTEPIENIRIHACTLGNINAQKGEGIFISDTVFGVIYVFVGTYVQANNCVGQQVMISSGNGYFSNCQFANTTQTSVVGFVCDNMPTGISEQVTFAHCRFVANENATHLLRFASHGTYFDTYESYQEKVVEFVDCSIELSTSGGFAQRLPGKELRMFNTKIHCKQTKLTDFFLANNKFPCKVTMNGCSVTSEGTISCLATFNSAVEYTFNLTDNVFPPSFTKLFLCNTAPSGTVRLFNNELNTMEIKNAHNLTFVGIPSKTSQLSNDSGYVTETELGAKGYLTQHQDLSSYAKTSQLPTKTSQLSNDSGYVTETELAAKRYLTGIPSEYVTDTELTSKGYLTLSTLPKYDGGVS